MKPNRTPVLLMAGLTASALLWACLAGVGVPPLAGQVTYTIGNVTYTVSDSLPDDPAEFARQVQARSKAERRRGVKDLFLAGCVADGGWAEAAFDGLERLAETDPAVRETFVSEIGDHWRRNMKYKHVELCSVDHPRIERLLTRYLREEHEAGLPVAGAWHPNLFGPLLRVIEAYFEAPESYEVVREILSDMTIARWFRASALDALVTMRQRMYGETKAVAASTVRANIGKAWAPPARFVKLVADGAVEAGLVFEMGCPVDGGWPKRAYDAVLTTDETDFAARRALIRALADHYRGSCPADLRHLESWLVEKLLAEHQAGLLHGWGDEHDDHAIGWRLVGWLQHQKQLPVLPETYTALRTVACDHSLYLLLRDYAAAGMERYRLHVLGETQRVAHEAIMSDIGFIATRPPREAPVFNMDPDLIAEMEPVGNICDPMEEGPRRGRRSTEPPPAGQRR